MATALKQEKPSDRPAVSIRNVSKRYRIRSAPENRLVSLLFPRYISPSHRLDQWALRDVSFDIPRGRKLALIGENGSGKSTLLKLIARLIKPTSGEIVVNGSVLPLLELGAGFHPELTGYENVFLQGAVLGLSRDEIRARLGDIVAFSGLEDFMESPVKYYSTGMFVRLGFSVAIHCNPDILLLDEILAVGDADFQDKSFHKMMEFVGTGRTLILVSHNLFAVKEICEEAIWLDDGRIRASGPAREIVQAYMEWASERIKPFEENAKRYRSARWEPPPKVPKCRIRSLRLLDSAGNECAEVLSRDPMAIEIECDSECDIADVDCRIVFRSKRDTPILQADSFVEGERLSLPAGRSVIRVSVGYLVAKQALYDVEAILYYKPPDYSPATLDTARTRLRVRNPDGIQTNYYLDSEWRFELRGRGD